MIQSRVLGGGKNLTLVVTGALDEDLNEPQAILEWKEPGAMKIASILSVIQEKMGVQLWWEGDLKEENAFLPLESRNGFRPDRPITPPDNWGRKLYLTAYAVKSNEYLPKRFWFSLEIDK